MLTLRQVGPHYWQFVYPAPYEELMDRFDAGCEMLEMGDTMAAEVAFRSTLSQMPDHLDAIHHLALVLSERGEVDHASDLWRLSVVIGRMAFPPEFERGWTAWNGETWTTGRSCAVSMGMLWICTNRNRLSNPLGCSKSCCL